MTTDVQEWPANCGHKFCSQCTAGCLNQSLSCPMCRADAPESARPEGARAQVLLSIVAQMRLEELERQRWQSGVRPPREPRTRMGRWMRDRSRAFNAAIDEIVNIF